MEFTPARVIIISQILLGTSLVLCTILIPRYLFSRNQGGVSNYGTHDATRGLFSFGFAAAASGTLLAGVRLRSRVARRADLHFALCSLGVLYLLVLLSTFSYKSTLSAKYLHELAAMALFVGMLLIASWLAVRGGLTNKSTQLAFIVFCGSFLIATLTLFGYLHLLFGAQIVCGVSFGYFLAHNLQIVETDVPVP